MNHANAYNYLVSIGCSSVEFVPESSVPGQKTPDLQGRIGALTVLCEVKTVNPSEEEIEDRNSELSERSPEDRLSEKFFGKLGAVLDGARTQLEAFESSKVNRKIVYLVLNYDDPLHEYAENYRNQLKEFIAKKKTPDLEIVLDAKPAGYSARS